MSNPPAHRLYRSRADHMLSGVSGGLAAYFDVDPVLVRLLWIAGAVLSGGALLLAYLALWILLPEEVDSPRPTPVAGPRPVAFEPALQGEAIPDGGSAGVGNEAEAGNNPEGTERWAPEASYIAPDAAHNTTRR